MSSPRDEAWWSCLLGPADRATLPPGSDGPLRQAVAEVYHRMTGEWPEAIFSGWDGEPTEVERAIIEEDRAVRAGLTRDQAAILTRLRPESWERREDGSVLATMSDGRAALIEDDGAWMWA